MDRGGGEGWVGMDGWMEISGTKVSGTHATRSLELEPPPLQTPAGLLQLCWSAISSFASVIALQHNTCIAFFPTQINLQ